MKRCDQLYHKLFMKLIILITTEAANASSMKQFSAFKWENAICV